MVKKSVPAKKPAAGEEPKKGSASASLANSKKLTKQDTGKGGKGSAMKQETGVAKPTLKKREEPAASAVTKKQETIPSNIGKAKGLEEGRRGGGEKSSENESDQTGLTGSAKKAPPTCSACGEVGHKKNSKACPKYDSTTPQEQPASDAEQVENQRPVTSEVKKDGGGGEKSSGNKSGQTGLIGSAKKAPPTCGACGEVGHRKNSKKCRRYSLQ